MQDYIYYIIGLIVLVFIGYIFLGGEKKNDTIENYSLNNNSTTTQETNNVDNATNTKKMNDNNQKNMNKEIYNVTLETNKGKISIELNSKIAPKTVENFVKLANSNYYNGIKFHRVINGFMIQAGDPYTKDDKLMDSWGTGGPGYNIEDEIFDEATYKTGYKRGVIAMANTGRPNSGGSQFFIMHKDYGLPPSYTIFGKVTSGMEVVDAIASVKTLLPGQLDRPIEPIIINKVTIE